MPAEHGGKWTTFPYQRAIMDAFSAFEPDRVTVKKSARVGYTHMILAFLLRNVHHDPKSQLFVLPTVDEAEDFSKGEVGPALDRHEFLRGIVSEQKGRTSDNTIKAKRYRGRTMWFVGSNSGTGFRRVHAPVILADEIDEFPSSAGKTKSHGGQGDPIELAWRRTQEEKVFRKLIQGSTPIDKGASRIDRAYAESDQRVLMVPCPHCDEWQPLEWPLGDTDLCLDENADYGLKWTDGDPWSAQYLCRRCHCLIDERQKLSMLTIADRENGWTAQAPQVKNHAGFFLWSAYSLSPNATWGHIASEYLRLRDDPVNLKTFVNTWLGLAWEERGSAADSGVLSERREAYPIREVAGAPEPIRMVPRGAVVLTAFADVQLDRLEVGIEGWGYGEENWKLEYQVLYGDPTAEPVWDALLEYVTRPRISERGIELYVRSLGIDSGYAAQAVYSFVRQRPVYHTRDGRTSFVWATKGTSGIGPVWPAKPSTNTIAKCPLYTVHVDTAKDLISSRMQKIQHPGPGFTHFPLFFGENYFTQLTAEHRVTTRDRRNFEVRAWKLKEGHKRNEAFDIAVGNYAALCALYSVGFTLADEVQFIDAATPGAPPPEVTAAPQQVASGRPVRDQDGPSWLGDTRGWLGGR